MTSDAAVATVGALLAHGAVALATLLLPATPKASVRRPVTASEMVEVTLAPAHDAPTEPESTPAEPATPEKITPAREKRAKPISMPESKAPEPSKTREPPSPPPEPPPEAARAGQALTAAADAPATPADAIVVGEGTSFAGGTTQAHGVASRHVESEHARAGGVEGGRGTTPPSVDRSRPAQLVSGSSWDCALPYEAEDEGIYRAAVLIEVVIDAAGRTQSVQVKDDPGYGFGREAKRCALAKRWTPALDASGQAAPSKQLVRVRFQ